MSRSFGGTLLTTRSPMRISPAGDVLQPGDHAQQGRLAAARRADQHDELAVVDGEVDAVDDLASAPKALRTSRIATEAICVSLMNVDLPPSRDGFASPPEARILSTFGPAGRVIIPAQVAVGFILAHILIGEPGPTLGSSPRAGFAGICARQGGRHEIRACGRGRCGRRRPVAGARAGQARAEPPFRGSRSTRSGRNRCRTTGSSARSRASRSTGSTASGWCTGRPRSTSASARPSRTRPRPNAVWRRRPCWCSTSPAT